MRLINRKAGMAGTNLGTAWIQIKPSMKGMTSAIRSELSGVGQASGADVGSKFSTSFAAKIGVISGIAQQAFAKVSSVVSQQMSDAIVRVDTLERFPKVMEQMGYSADAASGAIKKLVAGVEEVPTPLNEVVSGTQRLVSVTKDVDKASDWTLAISNAMLSNGASALRASDAMEQFLQVVSRGKPMGQDWLTIMEVAPGTMNELAKSLGYTSASLGGDMYTALQKGTLSMEDFMAALVDMNENGTESFGALAEVAKTATGGIETQLTTLRQTVSNLIVAAFQGNDISSYVESISNKLATIAPTLIKGIAVGIIGVAQALPAVITPVVEAVVGLLPEILEGIVTLFGAIVEALPEITNIIVQTIPTLVELLTTTLTSPDSLMMILQGFLTLMLATLQALPAFFNALNAALPTIISNIVEFLTRPETILAVMSAAGQMFMGLVMAVPNVLGSLFSAFGQLFGKLWELLKAKFGKFAAEFGNFIGGIFKQAINGVLAFIEGFINTPIDLLNGFLGLINDAFGWIGVHIDPISRINLPRLAQGGLVEGIGTDTSDSNLYALSKGEYVIRASAAREIGYDNLNQMNETGEISGGQINYFTINGYNKSPEELANIISRKIAFNQRGVIG